MLKKISTKRTSKKKIMVLINENQNKVSFLINFLKYFDHLMAKKVTEFDGIVDR